MTASADERIFWVLLTMVKQIGPARFGRLDLNAFVLLVAMLGGVAVFGTWGLLLGPLFVRLAVEALRIGRERRDLGGEGSGGPLVRPNGDSYARGG